MTPPFECPWCSHESTDRETFRTHLLVEHRKSELVEYVLDSQADERERESSDEALTH